jgi:hypothetical protein
MRRISQDTNQITQTLSQTRDKQFAEISFSGVDEMARIEIKIDKRLRDTQTRINRALREARDELANETREMHLATTATWSRKPNFSIKKHKNGFEIRVTGANAKIWRFVSDGTRAHYIRPRRAKLLRFQSGYSAKTTPNVIGSSAGGAFGANVFASQVRHPGTRPRNFEKIIRRDAQNIAKRIYREKLRELRK